MAEPKYDPDDCDCSMGDDGDTPTRCDQCRQRDLERSTEEE